MHQFVQSAIEAANQGDKPKAMDFLKQVVTANPNDIDAWLVLAAVVDEPERKRQCLKRVLALDPVNQLARDELFEMDRAALGGAPEFMPELEPVATIPPLVNPPTEPSRQASVPSVSPKPSAPQVQTFTLPLAVRLIAYGMMAVSLLLTFATVFSFKLLLAFVCFIFFLGLSVLAWFVSVQVKVSDKGILVDTLILQTRIGWNEISAVQPASFQGMELKRKKGKSVEIMGLVSGYPTIVALLRQKRPDLFTAESSNATSA